jgi:uncharacterized repeat protein (TIGR03803 family)
MKKIYLLAMLILCVSMVVKSQVNLIGITNSGGAEGEGTIISYKPVTNNVTLLKSFEKSINSEQDPFFWQATDGTILGIGSNVVYKVENGIPVAFKFGLGQFQRPVGGLILGPDGNYYGIAKFGGINNNGVIFSVSPSGQFSTLHQFTGGAGGGSPNKLILGSDGVFYGTLRDGSLSLNNFGMVFSYKLDGTFNILHYFDQNTGAGPSDNSFIMGTDGKLYGCTNAVGPGGFGNIYSLTTTGVFTILHNYDIAVDGLNPIGLTQGSDGLIYGTTRSGGANNRGTVFSVSTSGAFNVLRTFSGGNADGADPSGGLTEGSSGTFYGTTSAGGPTDDGLVFSITSAGNFNVIRAFQYDENADTPDGSSPDGNLFISTNGKLYGVASSGGVGDFEGAVYSMDLNGANYSILGYFPSISTSGYDPGGHPFAGNDGKVYGVTEQGGQFGAGTIYNIDAAGNFNVLHSFKKISEGGLPTSGVVQANDGSLFGITNSGGILLQDLGTIYKLTSSGTYTVLHTFSGGADGGSSDGGLLLASDGLLYGTTITGGANGSGVIFSVSQTGTYNVIYNFPSGNSYGRPSTLIEGSDGLLYGATRGASADFPAGIIFSVSKSGNFNILHAFNGVDGENPRERLLEASDGKLYGLTFSGGGSGFLGVLFSIEKSGNYTVLYRFPNGQPSGSAPPGSLMQASDGILYGFTTQGGVTNAGTIFSFNPVTQEFNQRVDLNATNTGSFPRQTSFAEINSCVSPVITVPANITVNAPYGKCSLPVSYNVTVTGSDNVVTYKFSGATTKSGSGTGSGQTFNGGVTTVTVSAKNSCDSVGKTFTVTVNAKDNQKPVVSCISIVVACKKTSGTYTIPVLKASDNCSIASVAYVITGTTNRSGTGLDASGTFNPGISKITWTVNDGAGNTSTAIMIVKVNDVPEVTIAPSVKGTFCNELILSAGSNCASPYSFEWFYGSTKIDRGSSISLGLGDPSGSYSVVVTDAFGCKSENSPVFNYDAQAQYTNYSVIAFNSLNFGNYNRVQRGSVGVTSNSGTANFGQFNYIPGQTSDGNGAAFVKAAGITAASNAYIPNRITGAASLILPGVFQNNTTPGGSNITITNNNWRQNSNTRYRNVTVNGGITATLTDSIYGVVTVKQGAKVIFTRSSINISQLIMEDGNSRSSKPKTRLSFNSKAAVKISSSVQVGSYCEINGGSDVSFYVASSSAGTKSFTVNGGANTLIDANIYIPVGSLAVSGTSSSLTCNINGMVIAQTITSGAYVNWSGNNCSSSWYDNRSMNEEEAEPAIINSFDVRVFSNPTAGDFQLFITSDDLATPIRVALRDITGRLISGNNGASPNSTTKMSSAGLAGGTYFAEVVQGDRRKVVKMVLIR